LVQGTQVQGVSEDVASAVSRLLDLEGLAVRDVDADAFGGRVVHVVTADLGRVSKGSGVGSFRLVW